MSNLTRGIITSESIPISKTNNEQIISTDNNNINHPNHYAKGRQYEPIDVINDWELNFQLGNAVKYISRAGRKQDFENQNQLLKTLEDLRKARWYLDYEITKLEKEFI